jgi:hypothetical protein
MLYVFLIVYLYKGRGTKNRTPGYRTVALPTFLSIFYLLFLTRSAKQLVNNLCTFQQKSELKFQISHLRENQNISVQRTQFAGSFVEKTSGGRPGLGTRHPVCEMTEKTREVFPNDKCLHFLTIVFKHL